MDDRMEKNLDEALRSNAPPSDDRIAGLVHEAGRVRDELQRPTPRDRALRALFIEGVGARRRTLPALRFLAPAALVVASIVAIAGFGRSAAPGEVLYPVREALATMGLASTPESEVERRLEAAQDSLEDANRTLESSPAQARKLVLAAFGDLDRARTLAAELTDDDRAAALVAIARLEERAFALVLRLERGDRPGPADTDETDDREGPNRGPDDGDGDDEDNSGPGGDDDGGDDNSGPGDDDGDGDDDNSGPGDGDDDNSGSGGGDGDDSDGDNSGPGGGDGDDDNSGPGGGDDSLDNSGPGDGNGDDSDEADREELDED